MNVSCSCLLLFIWPAQLHFPPSLSPPVTLSPVQWLTFPHTFLCFPTSVALFLLFAPARRPSLMFAMSKFYHQGLAQMQPLPWSLPGSPWEEVPPPRFWSLIARCLHLSDSTHITAMPPVWSVSPTRPWASWRHYQLTGRTCQSAQGLWYIFNN